MKLERKQQHTLNRNRSREKSWLSTLLAYASTCKPQMISAVILAIVSSVGGFLPYVALYQIISLYAQGTLSLETALPWCAFAAFSFIVQIVFHGISTMLSHYSAYTILQRLRLALIERLKQAPLGAVYARPFGSMKTTIVDRIETIERPLAHMIPELTASVLIPLAVLIYLITFDWRVALATFASFIIGAIPMMAAMKDYQQRYENYMKTNAEVNNIIVEYVEGIEVVKAFNQSSSSYEKFVEAITRFQTETKDWFNSTNKRMSLTMSIIPTTLLGVLPVIIALNVSGVLAPVEGAMSITLALGILGPLAGIAFFRSELESASSAVKDARELLNIEQLPDSHKEYLLPSYDIEFKDVRFAYEKGGGDVLQGISLTVAEGDFCALVGSSGGGKTTLARLLLRFWDINSGAITIGGVDLRDISVNQLSRSISFVTQDNFLYDCSLRDNIRVGRPTATDKEVEEAAEQTQCGDFIARLEQGFDTPAGEAGKQLSGGERQRIALARAFLKDAPILVLDEATAFTDPESEANIQRALSRLVKGKTLIVIAHRLPTVRHADQIVVLDHGIIVGQGTHEELLGTCTLYERLWDAHQGTQFWSVSTSVSAREAR